MLQHLTRRDVVKTLLVTSAYSLINNKLWAAKLVSEVSPALEDPKGIARVKVSDFAALNNNGGSVRLGSSNLSNNIPIGFPVYPIVINRLGPTEFVALESNCPHEGAAINALTGGLSGRMSCSNTGSDHGSQFDARGNVTRGPAGANLISYPTSFNATTGILMITIDQPDFIFNVTQTMVLNGAERRMELSWQSVSGVEYEVRHRPNFSTEPVRVSMATTLSGPVTALSRAGNDATQRCWVVPQEGYYQVAIRMRIVA